MKNVWITEPCDIIFKVDFVGREGNWLIEREGRLIEIIFQNDSNGYTIGILSCEDEDVTIIGYLPALKEGENVSVKGKWNMHPNYGRQLEVQEYRPIHPSTREGILSYLSSGVVKGIGEKMAIRIVDHFGEETLEIMQFAPHRLTEVQGIGEAKAQGIIEAFQEQREIREIILFLAQYDISPSYAVKIYKKYGEKTISIIQENPYRLAEDIFGIGFKIADKIAMSLGISRNSKYRIYSATRFVLNSIHAEGHTYSPIDWLINKTAELVSVNKAEIEDAIRYLALEQKVHLEKFNNDLIVYSMPYYYAEASVCKKVIELSQVEFQLDNIDSKKELQELQNKENIQLAQYQLEAVEQAISNGIMVITGGPGTGKTTTINILIKMFEKLQKNIILAAPTGRASKRMSEATGREAKTIHRLLELGYNDGEEVAFQRNEDYPLEADVVIIDEVSMVDILLMNSLLRAITVGTHLVLVGDVDQLPSVGAGNVLRDIISSNVVKVVKLNEIFRQAQESMIIVNAHRINKGEYPNFNVKDKDFFFINKNRSKDVADTLIELVKDRLPKHYNYDAVRSIQMLSPMKKGEVGTINLNKALQLKLNPPDRWKTEKDFNGKILRVGDKVMQVKNNYSLKWSSTDSSNLESNGEGVFNGDIGYIHKIDLPNQELTVLFDDYRLVLYDFSQVDELELAYCVTVHKSQGSEFPVVVMPIIWGPPMLLTRNLLYTAVTRARSLVVLVGTEDYLKQMVDNNQIVQRYSGLGIRLKKYFDFQHDIS